MFAEDEPAHTQKDKTAPAGNVVSGGKVIPAHTALTDANVLTCLLSQRANFTDRLEEVALYT